MSMQKRVASELSEYQKAKSNGDLEYTIEVEDARQGVCILSLPDGRVRVTFPHDYPFKPPKSELIHNELGVTKPLYRVMPNVGHLVGEKWSPSYMIMGLLREPYLNDDPLKDVFVPSFELRADDVVYIAIGCGGPALAQQYPRMVQDMHDSGSRVFIVLIDPQLFGANAQAKSGDVIRKDRVHIVLMQHLLLSDEPPLLQRGVRRMQNTGCNHVYVTDFRSGGGGSHIEGVNAACIRNPVTPQRDELVQSLLQACYGVNDVDDDVLSITDVCAHFRSRPVSTFYATISVPFAVV